MNPLLFVYGTLMAHTGTEKARQLASESRPLGQATIRGALYRISWYPGLVEEDGVVHGEVVSLIEPQRSLAWLDAYEGIGGGPAGAGPDEYERVEREVVLADGARSRAWVYLYRAGVAGCPRVTDGRWC